MIINYGISKSVRKPHRKREILSQNHSIEVNIDNIKSFAEAYEIIRTALDEEISQKYPGWSLIGFCEKEK
jgi:hypothetical protein